MNKITIRLATVEDITTIHNLLSALEIALGETAGVTRKLEDIQRFGFSDSPCFQALIAWRGSDAVGLAVYFKEFSTWKGAAGVYVQDLYVCADERGTGLGAKLMEAVYEQARSWGASYCKLTVHDGNDSALAFYKRLGFQTARKDNVLVLNGL